jgi:hypothetical protein
MYTYASRLQEVNVAVANVLCENIKRARAGEPLLHLLDGAPHGAPLAY